MTPVLHKACGAQIGWYLRDERRDPDDLLAEDYLRMDGTHPQPHTKVRETCPSCGMVVTSVRQIWRDFKATLAEAV